MTTKEKDQKFKEYMMKVSGGNKTFAEEMIKSLYSYVKREAPKSGNIILYLFGTDLERIARKTNADLSQYFNPGDLDVFEMEVSICNGEITKITYMDAPRKHSEL